MSQCFEQPSAQLLHGHTQRVKRRALALRVGVTQHKRELDWSATRELGDMLRDAWRWQCQSPSGYEEEQRVS
ncbi:hypothetical protein [Pseudomonas sp. LB3P31]